MHSGFKNRGPWKFCRFIQLSKTTGSRTPTRVADGHADCHDECCMDPCRRLRKLLRMQGKIVVIDKVASAGGARLWGNGVVLTPRHTDLIVR